MNRVSIEINGLDRRLAVDERRTLLDVLRDDLDLIGAKQSCDRQGQCGACTVIVDGKARRSCLVKAKDLDGSRVITVEGLGTPENPHLIQEAFALSGAIQCGFCTPGMILAAKALLDRNPDPAEVEIKAALKHNLCRCTGYKKIIQAVVLAGRFLRGEIDPEQVRPDKDGPKLGVSHVRPSAMAKACGTARFSADIKVPGALELAVVRSRVPHARIVSIDSTRALEASGVVGVITAREIKGSNRLKMVVSDRPVLCEDRVRYIGDPICAVAAETRDQALAAADMIEVELEELPVLESPAQAVTAEPLHDHAPNLCHTQPLVKGDVESALAGSAAVVEAEFNTQINHQAPLEPEACLAYWDGEDEDRELVVIGRSINIHAHLAVLQEALGWEDMRYQEAYSGGQFGLKLEITSEAVCAAAALHLGRPVRYQPSLEASMLMTSKRHPFQMKVRLGADEQGRLTGYENLFTVDNGAYQSIGNVVVYRALLMLSGAYDIPNLNALGQLVYTNNPWGSAARGAGPPQANFALECAVDLLADKMNIDPLEFRLRNILQPGGSKSTSQTVSQWPLTGLFEAVRPHYERAVKEAEQANNWGNGPRRGVGLVAGSFGIGGPGDSAVAAVELLEDGGVAVYAASADPGEGNDSMFTQLCAHRMGLPLNKVRLHLRSTADTTETGPSAGSRMTYMVGGAMIDALDQLKSAMEITGAETAAQLADAGQPVRYIGRKKTRIAGPLDPKTGLGPSFESEVHAVQMAEVEVNRVDGQIRVIRMLAAVDAGPVINPHNLEGQLEGGMDMGVGYALREAYVAGKTKDWRTFKFPTIADSFPCQVLIQETPREFGTLGSTGVGEMTLVPTAPAVINAVRRATGARLFDLPASPDKVKAALEELGKA